MSVYLGLSVPVSVCLFVCLSVCLSVCAEVLHFANFRPWLLGYGKVYISTTRVFYITYSSVESNIFLIKMYTVWNSNIKVKVFCNYKR